MTAQGNHTSSSRRWTSARRGPGRRRAALAVVTVAAFVALGVTNASADRATTGATSAKAAKSVTITLYSGQHEQTTAALVKAFEKQSGITVKVRSDDEAVFANQIAQEGSNTPADAVYTENTPPLEFLQEKGLLAKLSPSTLAAVPSQYNSTKGDWVGVSARVSVMVYNTGDLTASALPTSVLDLASPRWKGKIGISPGETDFQPIVTSIERAEGKAAAQKWLEAIKSNAGSHDYPDNEALVNMVNRGQVQIGLINHYYWYRLRDEVGASGLHSQIAFFAPQDPGYVLDVSGAAVLKSSQHRAAAQKLVAFLVSAAGEQIIATSESYEYPLGSGVVTTKVARPFSALQPVPLSLSQLGDGRAAIRLLQDAQLL